MSGLDPLELTGRARTHVVEVADLGATVHRDVVAPLRAMAVAAWAEAGIDLVPVSAFRDFARQRTIWNAKYRGERPLLDRAGRLLDAAALAPPERIEAILAWSALPGGSRHHWGTDLDVIDRDAMPPGYRPQLVPAEYARGGVFERLDRWLSDRMERFGFVRPYREDRGGVQPEAWHLSYAPLANLAQRALTIEVLADALTGDGDCERVEGVDELLPRLAEIHRRYVAA
jgi:LAS superfamily LD-carboxypeptidase LdcB